MVAIVKQAYIPALAHRYQETQQRTRAFGKLKAIQQFIFKPCNPATHHVTNMQLGQLTVGQVCNGITLVTQHLHKLMPFSAIVLQSHTRKDVRLSGIRIAIIKFGNPALADSAAEFPETTRLFRDRHSEQCLASLTNLRPFRHMPQTVKIHIGTAIDCHQAFTLDARFLDVFFQAGNGQRTGRFHDGAAVIKDIFYRRTEFIGGDRNDVINVLPCNSKRFFTGLAHCHSVCEDADLFQLDTATTLQCLVHARGLVRLYTDHLYIRPQGFHHHGNTGNQTATTDRYKNGMHVMLVLLQNFKRNGSLPGDDIRIIVGMNKGHATLLGFGCRINIGIIIGVTGQFYARTIIPGRLNLDGRCCSRHYDQRLDPQLARRQCHALGVVPGRCGNDTAGAIFFRQPRNLVIGTAQLERMYRLQVLALHPDTVAKTR